ncbi:MAG: tetratricopeptide repeat protein, partial [Terriglobia bacterium]
MRHPISSVYTTQFSLRSRTGAVGFLLAVTLVSVLLADEALRVGAAAVLANSFDLGRLERASTIDHNDPEIHRRLGSYYLYSVQDLDVKKAIDQFRLATRLSPFDATGWSDLAKACDFAGETVCADRAFDRALKLSPMAPHRYWDSALHFTATGRGDRALPYFRRLLELDPGYAVAVFRLCPESLENPGFILREVFPNPGSTKLDLEYVRFLSAHGKNELASMVWSHAMARASFFPFAWASPFLDSLLRSGHVQEAQTVWRDLENLSIVPAPPAADASNLVFNGGFERTPLGAGFDWRFNSSPYLSINLQSSGAYRGRRCLRVDFT